MKKNVLFLCTGNSCRSQMAEGWAKALKGDKYHFYSAGILKHGVNPNAIKVMQEAGVDISSHKSNTIDDLSDVKQTLSLLSAQMLMKIALCFQRVRFFM